MLPKEKIAGLLDETSLAVGGLGPALQRLVDGTQAIVGDFKTNIGDVNDIINNSGPIIDSQVNSSDAIQRWAANLNEITAQTAEQDQALRSGLQQAAPTADQVNAVFSDVRESLPQTLANLEIVFDMLKRYNKGVEQTLVVLPQGASIAQAVAAPFPGTAAAGLQPDDQPAAAVSDRLPARQSNGVHRPTPAPRRCPTGCTARSRRTRRPTWSAARVTIRASMCLAKPRQPRRSAAAISRTFRWAPTPGTATRTRC